MIADKPEPSPLRMVRLGDLLTDEQGKRVTKIMNETTDSIKRVRLLTEYLGTFKDELANKEIDYRFLAYLLQYIWTQVGHWQQ